VSGSAAGFDDLDDRQQKAVAALLAHPTILAAAAAIGVGESTLRRWLDSPHFAAAYRQARRQLVEQTIARLQQLGHKAAAALEAVLDDPEGRPQDKIRAAVALLGIAIQDIENHGILERLDALERQGRL
jgi:hypothetical protein